MYRVLRSEPVGSLPSSGWVCDEFDDVVFVEPNYYDRDQFIAVCLFLADIGQGLACVSGEYVTFDLEPGDYVNLSRAAEEFGLPYAHWRVPFRLFD